MKKITLFLLLFVIVSCNKKQSCDDNRKIREVETANIIQTFIDNKDVVHLPICKNLKKLTVRTDLMAKMNDSITTVKLSPKSDIMSRNTEVFIEKLMERNKETKLFFNKKDSLSFLLQNQCSYNKYFPEKIKAKTISLATLESKKLDIEYVIISIPIFSSHNKKAYIEIDRYTKIHKYGESFFLEKIGKKWKIIRIERNWSAC